jgi:hypothetical protein
MRQLTALVQAAALRKLSCVRSLDQEASPRSFLGKRRVGQEKVQRSILELKQQRSQRKLKQHFAPVPPEQLH